MSILHVVSVSGGKDSAATLLLAVQRFGTRNLRPIFCDTGNEHEAVYTYLTYLEGALGVTITRLKADFSDEIARKRMFIARDQRTKRKNGRRVRWTNAAKRRALANLYPSGNPFLDLCMLKGRFPSRMAQFCTERLKRDIAVDFQIDLALDGNTVISWQGIRRDESHARRNAKKFEKIGPRMYAYRPIVDWTAVDVFAYCAQHGIEPNPLYLQGMGRVGCMPCINANKNELSAIAARFPDHIARIDEWENKVALCSKHYSGTFFHKADIEGMTFREMHFARNIHEAVEWAKTTRGGKQYNLLAVLDEPTACSSSYGLCE